MVIPVKRFLLSPVYRIYEYSLYKQVKSKEKLPHHIGIIMDGNRRQARAFGINLNKGYELGAEKLEIVLDWMWNLGIKVVSVWVFSTENFQRESQEIASIMEMAEKKTIEIRESRKIHERKVKVRYSGDLSLLPKSLQEQIKRTESETENHSNHILNICLAYGGRAELTSAIKKIASNVEKGNLLAEDIDENLVEQYLYTNGLPDPDLIIRTSGSVRLSGFLMWQSIYSELYFTDVLWPSFRKVDLFRAIRDYQGRKRNFGK